MLEFIETMVLTGIEKKVSKSGTEYTLAYLLGENGQTFSVPVDCEVPEGLQQLDKVEVLFKYVTGRYPHIKIIDLKKVV